MAENELAIVGTFPLADPTLAHTQTSPGSADDVFLLSAAETQALVCKHVPVLPNLKISSLFLSFLQPPTTTHTPRLLSLLRVF